MSNQDIIDLYDANPDLTLTQLSRLTGLSISQLKKILMS